ncbi:B-box zinc finger protein 32 [Silene latifolia]|uniref:B-box zinc finger protein 32 n=1 Tax=Silene latifolia TaxID=37657 RepID=UPI003D778F0A
MAELRRNCELCGEEASVYCPSDAAFLCQVCDEKVHCANFLVARHVRVCVCPQCQALPEREFSGRDVSFAGNVRRVCQQSRSLHVEEDEDCLSSSSSCVSSTGEEAEVGVTSSSSASSRRKRRDRRSTNGGMTTISVDAKVGGILVNWSRTLGVEDPRVVQTAAEILSRCTDKMTILPLRVSLATVFWLAMRLCYGETSNCQTLRRLEQISGVPAKLIIATEHRMARVIKRRQPREDHEEGWAESY